MSLPKASSPEHQRTNADRHDDAVDRRPRPVLFQQPKKAQPLLAILFMHGITSGGIKQDTLRGKKPVAVSCPPDPLDDGIAAVVERKFQSGIHHRRTLSGRRIANGHVPRKLVKRLRSRHLTELGSLDRLDRLLHALLECLNLRHCSTSTSLGCRIGLLLEHRTDGFAGLA
ncbi:hypothetical protein SDC9_176528 [bioreactor metagenome]|uniref:Uncharacterized protein n=1 Tax=bioreactor metagenome TaxID=1076179 RepID=A0A645GTE4_9ZZZZ